MPVLVQKEKREEKVSILKETHRKVHIHAVRTSTKVQIRGFHRKLRADLSLAVQNKSQ